MIRGPLTPLPLPQKSQISSFQLNQEVFKNRGLLGGFQVPLEEVGTQFQKFENKTYTERWSQSKAKISAFQLIQKVFKNRRLLGGFRPPHKRWGVQFQTYSQSYNPNLQPKFQHRSSIKKCLKQIEQVKMFKFVTLVP